MLVTKELMAAIDSMEIQWKSMATVNYFVTSIFFIYKLFEL